MNAAKFTTSEDISDSVPMPVPKLGLLAFWFSRLVELRRPVKHASRDGAALVGKTLVRYSLLDVVSLSCKNQERLVLRFPAEAGDGAVIAAGVEDSANFQRRSGRCRGGKVSLQSSVGRGLHQAKTKQRSRGAENHVAGGKRGGKIGLRQGAARGIGPAGNRKQVVDAAVECAGGSLNEAGFEHGAIRRDK